MLVLDANFIEILETPLLENMYQILFFQWKNEALFFSVLLIFYLTKNIILIFTEYYKFTGKINAKLSKVDE